MRKAALLLFALLLAGCTSRVSTDVHVSSAKVATTSVAVSFDGEAAQQIRASASLQEQLAALFTKYAGGKATVSDKGGVLTYSSSVDYAHLAAASALTGVKSASVAGTDKDVTVTMALSAPGRLAEAILQATSSMKDAGGVQAAMLAQTHVAVSVEMPGGVKRASAPGVTIQRSGDTASVDQVLQKFQNTTFVVEGSSQPSFLSRYWVGILVVVLALVALFVWRRRRR